jgi:hypothetical protein
LVQLRRFLLLGFLVGLFVVPAAIANREVATSGGVTLELEYGHGLAKISWRGTLLGRVRRGRIVATRNVFVGHSSSRKRLSDRLVAYRGRRMTLRVLSTDGAWRVRIRGRGISVSGVVTGRLVLDGVDSGKTGLYSIASGPFRSWPRAARRFALSS